MIVFLLELGNIRFGDGNWIFSKIEKQNAQTSTSFTFFHYLTFDRYCCRNKHVKYDMFSQYVQLLFLFGEKW